MKAVSRLSTKIFQFEQELDNVWKKTAATYYKSEINLAYVLFLLILQK